MSLDDIQLKCPNCGNDAEWIPNEQVYNGTRYGKSYMCWYCRPCDFMVGCENNTKKPLGTMIGREQRQLRRKVHAKIDPLWKGTQKGKRMRARVYGRISKVLGFTFHTGEADEEICKKVLAIPDEYLRGTKPLF